MKIGKNLNSTCYKLFKNKTTSHEANKTCTKSQNGNLASILNEQTETFITKNFPSDDFYFWLGGRQVWQWIDGTVWKFTVWKFTGRKENQN